MLVPSVNGLPRLIAVIQLALQGADPHPDLVAKPLLMARTAGLTGAEIDAASEGRSFDVSANAAIALALAMLSKDAAKIELARQHAWLSGLSSPDVLTIENAIQRMLERSAGSR